MSDLRRSNLFGNRENTLIIMTMLRLLNQIFNQFEFSNLRDVGVGIRGFG